MAQRVEDTRSWNIQTMYWQRKHHRHRYLVCSPDSKQHIEDNRCFLQNLQPETVVVYLHGMGCDAAYLARQFIEKMVVSGMTVVCMDLEGHGRDSQGMFISHVKKSTFMQELGEYLYQQGILRHHVVGMSLGGVFALQEAFRRSALFHRKGKKRRNDVSTSRLLSLSLVAVPWHHSPRFISALGELRILQYGDFWAYLRKYGLSHTVPALGALYRHRYPVRIANTSSPFYQVISQWIAQQPVLRYLEEQSYPTLWVDGEYDRVIPQLPQYFRELSYVSYVSFAVTHLGALLSSQVINRIVEHIRCYE